MRTRRWLAHLLVPAAVACAALAVSLAREPLSGELLLTHLAGGFLFYAAPHLLWVALCSVFNPTRVVQHLGLLVSSAALLAVCALSLWGPRDPSGLPYQWLVYWPLAGTALLVVLVGWALAGRPHAAA